MKQMTLKRLLIGLLASTMLLGTLAACNPTQPSEDTTTESVEETTAAVEVETTAANDDTDDTTAADVTEETTTAEEETTDPTWRDTPKTGPFVTTTDLELPEYSFAPDGDPLENDGIIPTTKDVFSDTWVAVDGADRTMPDAADTPVANEKKVGIFYFLWHERRNAPIYNHHEAYMEGGLDGLWETMMAEGLTGNREPGHYWAEPYFGYYKSDDEWVIRKHAYMLTEAGVDFVYFDVTNGLTYGNTAETVMRVWNQMREEGYATPDVCFFAANSSNTVNALWNRFYKHNLYENIYFYWDGAPLILLAEHSGTGTPAVTEEQAEYFTVRYSWAETTDWYNRRNGEGCWPWRCSSPQGFGYSPEGRDWVEQISVTCGHSANGRAPMSGGRSSTGNRVPRYTGEWEMGYALMKDYTPYGILFSEQFEYALQQDARYDIPLMLITGWNEWWAQLQLNFEGLANGQTMANTYEISNNPNVKEFYYFVDQFTPEYSRDIEPMKDGFTDNYLYQMSQYLRKYKGSRDVETAFGQWAIDINGSVGQWYAVGPEYRDYQGDTVDRNSISRVGDLTYINETGRNDIVMAKVSNDSRHLYFYVECAEAITEAEGENWMNLFINADGNNENGWYGYDFILNRSREDGKVSVEAFTGECAWEFETVGYAEYTQNGNVLQIKLPRAMIDFGDTLDFKWADNSVASGDIMQFWDLGDAAPNGRYAYRYTLKDTMADDKIPEELTNDMVVLKVNSYNAYVDGKMVRLVDDNTNGVLLASNDCIWLPTSFLKDAFGISVTGAGMYNHYGIEYMEATQLLQSKGKTLTFSADGLVVIADERVTDEAVLTTLYRALS